MSLGRTQRVAALVHVMQGASSRWMARHGVRGFAWQNGYAAFSVGESQRPTLERYVARQAEHHHRWTFQQELRQFLDRYGVEYDERYLWDCARALLQGDRVAAGRAPRQRRRRCPGAPAATSGPP